MADYGDRHFDPAAGMLLLPMSGYRNVHAEHLDDTPRHPVRESLYYALVLLELADRSLQGRAEVIIRRLIALQEASDPEAKTFGLWPYFLEDPVAKWSWPDFNWADFNAMTLLFIWHRHGRRLSASLATEIEQAIARAAICIRRRNVDLNYTNIAIKGTFVTLSAAEISGDADLHRYALDRLGRLRDTVLSAGGFVEYNSPTYAAISLAGLHAIGTYVRDERARVLTEPLLERFWRDVAERFHPETMELAGPHARAYTTRLGEAPELLGSLIEKASRGSVVYPLVEGREPFGALYACVVNVDAPADVVAALSARASKPRQTVVRSQARPTEAPRVQTTWLEPAFCLGSVSFQDGWEQRHNLIAYWKSKDGKIGSLTHRYLRDDRPCCSGYFVSEQREGAVAAGAFLGAYADHHVSIPTEGTTCAFLGPVIELDAAGEKIDVCVDGCRVGLGESVPVSVGGVVRLTLSAVTFEWSLMKHDVSPAPKSGPRVESVSADRLRIVLPHYEGMRRQLRWLDFERAASGYALSLAASGAAFPKADGLDVVVPETTPVSPIATETWALHREVASV
ncbi:MAG: hypothetical protein WC205_00425 [Opitutaceae bacterium]|jgi:hypothetical protein